MPWVRFDDQFPIHRKVDSLSDPAFRLHVSAIFWSARNLTDGYVPEIDLDAASPRTMQRPSKFVSELVRRGAWAKSQDGWQIHDYLDYQPSKVRVVEDRKKNAMRQKRFRDKDDDSNGVSHGVSNATPSRPEPVEEDSLRSPSSTPRRNDPPRRDVDQLCERLLAQITDNGARAKITAKWRTEARLMLDRDRRDLNQALRLIDWATGHEFWSANVLSMSTFRAKYDQLLLQAKREFRQKAQPQYKSQTDANIETFMRGTGIDGPRQLPPGGDP